MRMRNAILAAVGCAMLSAPAWAGDWGVSFHYSRQPAYYSYGSCGGPTVVYSTQYPSYSTYYPGYSAYYGHYYAAPRCGTYSYGGYVGHRSYGYSRSYSVRSYGYGSYPRYSGHSYSGRSYSRHSYSHESHGGRHYSYRR